MAGNSGIDGNDESFADSSLVYDDFIIGVISISFFDKEVGQGYYDSVTQFFEEVSSELYKTRLMNYSWGYNAIEPQIDHKGSKIILRSKLFMKENLIDLNAMIVKLFVEHCTIILSVALSRGLPLKGIISIGELAVGNSISSHPDILSKKDSLIMEDLLKAYSLSEMFPEGMHGVVIPPYNIPLFFGETLSEAEIELSKIESVGIFMAEYFQKEVSTEISILSDMMLEVVLDEKKYFACNWKDWIEKKGSISMENVFSMAKEKLLTENAKDWKSFISYSSEM